MNIPVYGSGRIPKKNTGPLLVQVVPQLSVEQIFRDYCRGVLHPGRPALYDPDQDEDPQEFYEPEDISELSEEMQPAKPVNDKKRKPAADRSADIEDPSETPENPQTVDDVTD